MSIAINDKKECCGCALCAAICPHKAINMNPDALGFLYPKVDKDKCTECGLCEKVCSFNKNHDVCQHYTLPEIYAGKHKSPNEVESSQSGAAFVAISDWILENDGVVYGVGFGEHFAAIHKRATTMQERDEFRGSKYVQSYMGNVFADVKTDLHNGFTVLFSGTPCQVAALSSFIGQKFRDKLILVDIVCHGVPSPRMWQDYLNYIECKNKKDFKSVNFRDKKFGWHSHIERFDFKDSYVYTEVYRNVFYSHLNMRPSCSSCPYTNLKRPSDITIADFWGIEKTEAKELGDDNKGCSMFLLNTEKGRELFNEITTSLIYKPVKLSEDWLQPQLKYPSQLHPKYQEFEKDYARIGMEKTLQKYGFIGRKVELRKFIEKYKIRIKKIMRR